mmetsp:Transcript_87681/g.200368  ORF Transcript_87681/g.200368 Transcript_87681/m.200368 type:complete len:226 (+) Transcript_87681:1043-1720(+)
MPARSCHCIRRRRGSPRLARSGCGWRAGMAARGPNGNARSGTPLGPPECPAGTTPPRSRGSPPRWAPPRAPEKKPHGGPRSSPRPWSRLPPLGRCRSGRRRGGHLARLPLRLCPPPGTPWSAHISLPPPQNTYCTPPREIAGPHEDPGRQPRSRIERAAPVLGLRRRGGPGVGVVGAGKCGGQRRWSGQRLGTGVCCPPRGPFPAAPSPRKSPAPCSVGQHARGR